MQRLQGRGTVPGGLLIEKAVSGVELGDKVDVAQNGGLFLRHRSHRPEVPFRHGQGVAAVHRIPAGGQLLLLPVHGVVDSLRRALVVDAADPVVKALRRHIRPAVPLDAREHLHPPGVRGPRCCDGCAVGGHVPGQHQPGIRGDGGMGMAGNAKILNILYTGSVSHSRQRIATVAKVRMVVEQHQGVFFIASAPV